MPQTDLKKARANAAAIGVEVKPSKIKNKKLDVFKNGEKVASIGHIDYFDYLTFNDKDKKARQKAYLARHAKTIAVKNSPSFYAAKILWA
tara:strand:+ start:506 stop:775 length:270 start_codon:yes stop_codon:yes gene_type:complete